MRFTIFLFALLLLAVLGVMPAGAVYVGFEPSAYTLGNPLPSPWTVAGTYAVSDTAPSSGTQCLALSNNGSGVAYARMPMYADSAQGQVIIRTRIRPDDYNPGSYQPGYVGMGGMAVWDTLGVNLLGSVYFDLAKPYTVDCGPQHRTIRYYMPPLGDFTFAGYWLPGQYHTLQFTFDWTHNTVELRIERPDGVVYKYTGTPGSTRINLAELAGTHLGGGGGVPNGYTRFDDFVYPATPQVATPAFTPGGGTYTTPQSVAITCGTTGADIRYTTNGSVPTETSTQYLGTPVSVNTTTTLKAKAFKTNWTASAVQSATYQIVHYQPDLRLRLASEGSYTGDNLYSTTGDDQKKSQTIAHGATATYLCYVQNDGDVSDTMTITGQGSDSDGWQVKYYEMGTNTDITASVSLTGGWHPTLAPGVSRGFYAKVTAGPGVQPAYGKTLAITALSGGDATKRDVVKCETIELLRKPDLTYKPAGDVYYEGRYVFGTDGLNQTSTAMIDAGDTATFHFRVYNDGNITDTLKVTSQAGDVNWTIGYTAQPAGTTITGDVTGAGWVIANLPAGQYVEFYASLQAGGGLAPGAGRAIFPTVRSVADGTKKDVVKAVARIAIHKPDLWVRNQSDSSYLGNNVYSLDGSNQVKAQTVATSAVYLFYVQNDGTATEPMIIQCPSGSGGWSYAFYQMGTGTDITGALTGDGWTTPELAPGATQGFWVRVTAGSGVVSGALRSLPVTAFASGDTSKMDAVRVNTTKQIIIGDR